MDNLWLFITACLALSIVPGPDMIYLLSISMARGKRAGFWAALGINLGAYVHLLAALLGLSAILMTSSVAFSIVKWIGGAYLIYLGINAIISKKSNFQKTELKDLKSSHKKIFWQGFLSDVLNPKVAVFFMAFLPQFVDPAAGETTTQLLWLGVLLNVICILFNILLVYFSSFITGKLRGSNRISTWLNWLMGATFIALGIRLVREKG